MNIFNQTQVRQAFRILNSQCVPWYPNIEEREKFTPHQATLKKVALKRGNVGEKRVRVRTKDINHKGLSLKK